MLCSMTGHNQCLEHSPLRLDLNLVRVVIEIVKTFLQMKAAQENRVHVKYIGQILQQKIKSRVGVIIKQMLLFLRYFHQWK